MPNRKKKKKSRQKKQRTKNFCQLCSLKTIEISISTSLNISTVSALNESLQEIMKNAARTLLLLALGVANATEDQVTNGKHIHP